MSNFPAGEENNRPLTIALAGNPNVGKSSIFNQLTGLNQTVGNWPGKTVELAEGVLVYKGRRIRIIDLPGTYSLSSFSEEEVVARDYILSCEADVIVDVVDATALERNLYLTLQLLEMGAPLVVALNMVDDASKKGIEIKSNELSERLGVPVVPVIATSGLGLTELMGAVLFRSTQGTGKRLVYGKEIEAYVEEISGDLRASTSRPSYPAEWIAIKLLEDDPAVRASFKDSPLMRKVSSLSNKVEELHGEPAPVVIASERYSLSHRIAEASTSRHIEPIRSMEERVDDIVSHRFAGYLILLAVLGSLFYFIFFVGGIASSLIDGAFSWLITLLRGPLYSFNPAFGELFLNGVVFGIGAATSIALPYIATFYFLLSILEDTGYLPRAAFLLDSLMHKIGLHGKAFIPMLLGYGCSVPACVGCRIMETKRERFLLGALVVLVPCSARTVIILGVAGAYVGIGAALAIYILDLAIVFAIGRVLFKVLPEEPVGLIMEMPRLRLFKPKTILKKTWFKTKDFVYMALPLIVAGSFVVALAGYLNVINVVVGALSPLTVGLLGLPVGTGIALIFGLLRKELALIMLATYFGTTNFALFMTSAQMLVFTIVMVLYIPCIATFVVLVREHGARRALAITLMAVALAITVGFVAMQALTLAGV